MEGLRADHNLLNHSSFDLSIFIFNDMRTNVLIYAEWLCISHLNHLCSLHLLEIKQWRIVVDKILRFESVEVCHFGSLSGTKKINFRIKILPKNLFYKILCLPFQQGTLGRTTVFISYEWFLGHFLNF